MPYSELEQMQEQGQGGVGLRRRNQQELDHLGELLIGVVTAAVHEQDPEGIISAFTEFAQHTQLPYDQAMAVAEQKAGMELQSKIVAAEHASKLRGTEAQQKAAYTTQIKRSEGAEKNLYDIQLKEVAGEFDNLTPERQKALQELKTSLRHQIAGGPPTSMRQKADGSGWEQVQQSPDGSWRGPGQQQRSGIFMQAPGEEGGGWNISDSPEGRQIAGAAANRGPGFEEQQALYQQQVQLQKELDALKKQGPHTVNYEEGEAIGSDPNMNPQGYRKHDPAIDWNQARRGGDDTDLGTKASRGDFRGEGPMYEEGGPGWEAQQRHGALGDGQDFQRRAVRGQVNVRATQDAGDAWRAEYASKRAELQAITEKREALREQGQQEAANPEHRQAREALNQQARQQAEAEAHRAWRGNADVTQPGQGGTDTADSAGMNPATGAPDNRRRQAVLARHAETVDSIKNWDEQIRGAEEEWKHSSGEAIRAAQAKPLREDHPAMVQRGRPDSQQPVAQQVNQDDPVEIARAVFNEGRPANVAPAGDNVDPAGQMTAPRVARGGNSREGGVRPEVLEAQARAKARAQAASNKPGTGDKKD